MARRAALVVMEAGVTLVVTGMDRLTPGVKGPGRASGSRLLGSGLDALRDHLRLVHSTAADDIKRLLAWSGEAHALRRHAGGNRAEQLSLRTEDSDSRSGCDGGIQAASVVDGESIAAAHRKDAWVLEASIRLHVERHDGAAVGCVERLLIRTELHAIDGLQILTRLRQLSLWRDVEEQGLPTRRR